MKLLSVMRRGKLQQIGVDIASTPCYSIRVSDWFGYIQHAQAEAPASHLIGHG